MSTATDQQCCDKGRLMIVDDESTVRRMFSSIVRAGFPNLDQEAAANGQEAVDLFQKSRPAVILMDLHMPKMDGLTAFRSIERLCRERSWEMPGTIFCTGYEPDSSLQEIVSGEEHCLLLKPIMPEDLLNEIGKRIG